MKRIIALTLTILILVFSLAVGADAAKSYVFDYTGKMSAEQKSSVESTCKAINSEYKLDVMFVIANGTNGKSLERFTTDIYDEYCTSEDGVIFAYNEKPATEDEDNWVMIGFGKGKKLAGNRDTRADLIDQMRGSLKSGDYYNASKPFTSKCRSFAQGGFKGDPIDVKKLVIRIGISVVAGLIISYIIVSGMKKKLNTAVKQRGAMKYIKGDTAKVTVERDLFMYSTTTRVRRESESSSSGGHSFSGTSGGGRSYSGGGGRI